MFKFSHRMSSRNLLVEQFNQFSLQTSHDKAASNSILPFHTIKPQGLLLGFVSYLKSVNIETRPCNAQYVRASLIKYL